MSEAEIKKFLAKGGSAIQLPPRYKGFKKPELQKKISMCGKCKNEPATMRFSDDDGNKYYWCEGCYDE